MITEFRIQNFRNIEDMRIPLCGEATNIVGWPGKSMIVEFLTYFQALARGCTPTLFIANESLLWWADPNMAVGKPMLFGITTDMEGVSTKLDLRLTRNEDDTITSSTSIQRGDVCSLSQGCQIPDDVKSVILGIHIFGSPGFDYPLLWNQLSDVDRSRMLFILSRYSGFDLTSAEIVHDEHLHLFDRKGRVYRMDMLNSTSRQALDIFLWSRFTTSHSLWVFDGIDSQCPLYLGLTPRLMLTRTLEEEKDNTLFLQTDSQATTLHCVGELADLWLEKFGTLEAIHNNGYISRILGDALISRTP